MEEFNVMEQNLARLISQHQSMPQLCQEQPVDPFLKIQFGKKMRKSKINQSHSTSRNYEALSLLEQNKEYKQRQQKQKNTQQQQKVYLLQISSLFSHLRTELDGIEKVYKSKAKQFKEESIIQKQESQDIISYLQGSIDFILNNCLRLESREHNFQRVKDQGQNKENIRSNNASKVKAKSGRKETGKIQKSIYESVLQERELRRARKKLI